MSGLLCDHHPDVFLMSLLLFLGTFLIIIVFKQLRSTRFFNNPVKHDLLVMLRYVTSLVLLL